MPRTVTCGVCGVRFECSGTADCWCSSVLVEGRTLVEIRNKADDCVCKKCLGKSTVRRATVAKPSGSARPGRDSSDERSVGR